MQSLVVVWWVSSLGRGGAVPAYLRVTPARGGVDGAAQEQKMPSASTSNTYLFSPRSHLRSTSVPTTPISPSSSASRLFHACTVCTVLRTYSTVRSTTES